MRIRSTIAPMTTMRLLLIALLATPTVAQTPFHATRFLSSRTAIVGPLGFTCFAFGDVDGDGDQDAVFGTPDRLLLNDGRGHFQDATATHLPPPGPFASTTGIDLVDLDGDGDLDLVTVHDALTQNRVLTNNGNGVFTDVTATALPPTAWHGLVQAVGDFDGDGDVDWFTAAGAAKLYFNNGNGVFADVSATHLTGLPNDLGSWSYFPQAVGDVDHDGDPDLLVSTFTGSAVLLENLGGGHFAPAVPGLPPFYGNVHRLVDLDGDVDLDILANDGRLVLQNQGGLAFVDVTSTAFPTPPAASVASFDVDGDGDMDLLTAQVLWTNDGAGHFASQTLPATLPLSIWLDNRQADLDGDGDLDLFGLANFTTQLDAPSAPARGTTYTVEIHCQPSVAPTLVAPAAAFAQTAIALPGIGLLRLDLTQGMLLPPVTTTTGLVQLLFAIPTNPVFAGWEVHFQAALLTPTRPLFLSNAIQDFVQ